MNWTDGMESPKAIEPPESVVNTLALKHTAGNSYDLVGDGSLTITAGYGITIGISATSGDIDVAVYGGDGRPHYGLISVSGTAEAADTNERAKGS